MFYLFTISAVGNAFAVLSDTDKRKKYDMYGPEEERQASRSGEYTYNYSHGFEGTTVSLYALNF